MRMCLDHFNRLKESVENSSIGGLVAKTPEDIALKQGDDPLLYAQTMISLNFVDMLDHIVGIDEVETRGLVNDTETCPICWTSEHCPCPDENCGVRWLDDATELAVERFQAVMN